MGIAMRSAKTVAHDERQCAHRRRPQPHRGATDEPEGGGDTEPDIDGAPAEQRDHDDNDEKRWRQEQPRDRIVEPLQNEADRAEDGGAVRVDPVQGGLDRIVDGGR